MTNFHWNGVQVVDRSRSGPARIGRYRSQALQEFPMLDVSQIEEGVVP